MSATLLPTTPVTLLQSCCGGALIGLATSSLFHFTGRLAGLSGIFRALLAPFDDTSRWKTAFTGGFLLCGSVLAALAPTAQLVVVGMQPWRYVLAGLLVGCGTRLSNGCTSGHGIAGISRLSTRSFVAVLTFMTGAIATASTLYLNGALASAVTAISMPDPTFRLAATVAAAGLAVTELVRSARNSNLVFEGVTMLHGALFAAGLHISGMTVPANVLNFLVLQLDRWNPSLLMVMVGAIVVTFISLRLSLHGRPDGPVLANCDTFELPPCTLRVDFPLVLGAWLFGVGWGITGLCPGPALLSAAAGVPGVICYFVPTMFAGMYVGGHLNQYIGTCGPLQLTQPASKLQ